MAHAGTTTESRIMSPEAVSYTRHWNCSKISAGKQPAEAWDHKGLLVRKWGRTWCWNKLLNPLQAQKEHGEKAQKITLDFVIYIFFSPDCFLHTDATGYDPCTEREKILKKSSIAIIVASRGSLETSSEVTICLVWCASLSKMYLCFAKVAVNGRSGEGIHSSDPKRCLRWWVQI